MVVEKVSLKEKENRLVEKIEKAKKDLIRLQDKRRVEIGRLACKHGLDCYEDDVLNQSFSDLSKALANGNK